MWGVSGSGREGRKEGRLKVKKKGENYEKRSFSLNGVYELGVRSLRPISRLGYELIMVRTWNS
jgi:hypothetical protein